MAASKCERNNDHVMLGGVIEPEYLIDRTSFQLGDLAIPAEGPTKRLKKPLFVANN
jgi:hypothetical protein